MSFFERHSESQDKSSQARELFEKGEKYFESQEYDKAIEAYTSAISLNPNYVEAYFKRGQTRYIKQEVKTALDDIEKALSIDPKHIGALLVRGLIYVGEKQQEKIIESFSLLLSVEPNNEMALSQRGFAYRQSGQFDKAIEDLSKSLSINPNDEIVYFERGLAYASKKQFDESIRDFDKAISIKPDFAEVYTTRGIIYGQLGDVERTLSNLKKGSQLGDKIADEHLIKINNSRKEEKTIIRLKEVEPFNIPPVDNNEAAMFTKRLTGSETFEFDGDQRPQSIVFYDLKYNYPEHSYAHGWLLSRDIDTFISMCNSGRYDSMEPILKAYVIGSISFEYGGNLTGTQVQARKLSL